MIFYNILAIEKTDSYLYNINASISETKVTQAHLNCITKEEIILYSSALRQA